MWTIEPYHGAGSLRFGSSQKEAERRLGPPASVKANFLGGLTERRGETDPILTFAEGQLSEIEFLPSIPGVRIGGIDIFGEDPFIVLSRLYTLAGSAYAGVGSVLFLPLGVNTTGFIDLKTLRWRSDPDERSLTVFRKGQFDFLLEDMSPWVIPSL